jgi:hypothetical protein
MRRDANRRPPARAVAAIAVLVLTASLGACSGGSDARSGKACISPHDEKLWDNSRLPSSRLNEIIDCWSANRKDQPAR